jgi:hypothetical protein
MPSGVVVRRAAPASTLCSIPSTSILMWLGTGISPLAMTPSMVVA